MSTNLVHPRLELLKGHRVSCLRPKVALVYRVALICREALVDRVALVHKGSLHAVLCHVEAGDVLHDGRVLLVSIRALGSAIWHASYDTFGTTTYAALSQKQ